MVSVELLQILLTENVSGILRIGQTEAIAMSNFFQLTMQYVVSPPEDLISTLCPHSTDIFNSLNIQTPKYA